MIRVTWRGVAGISALATIARCLSTHPDLLYDEVVQIIDIAKGSGVDKIGLMTEQLAAAPNKGRLEAMIQLVTLSALALLVLTASCQAKGARQPQQGHQVFPRRGFERLSILRQCQKAGSRVDHAELYLDRICSTVHPGCGFPDSAKFAERDQDL
jgi:hypothetical protein